MPEAGTQWQRQGSCVSCDVALSDNRVVGLACVLVRFRGRLPFALSHKGDLTSHSLSTELRHHCALRFEARTGLPPTWTKTGYVWPDGRIRSETHELRPIAGLNVTLRGVPSARKLIRSTAMPFTTSSSGTSRVS